MSDPVLKEKIVTVSESGKGRFRKISLNILLLLAGVVVSLIIGEVVVRVYVGPPSNLYMDLRFAPELESRGHALRFLELQDKKEKDPLTGKGYDPILGWDLDVKGDRIKGSRVYTPEPAEGIKRIVAIGDSFTYGAEVRIHESFPAQLEKMRENWEVLNMGVGGYGIDQALLKYVDQGRKWKPHVVVLGVHPPDWQRATLSFFTYAKPHYALDAHTGTYRLENSPVPTTEETLKKLRWAMPTLYLPAFVRREYLLHKWQATPDALDAYWKSSTMMLKHALEEFTRVLREDGTELLIVQIPLGDRFASHSYFVEALEKDMQAQFLLGLYDAFLISHVDLLREFPSRMPREAVWRNMYSKRKDGSCGHLTVEGNRLVAEILSKRLDKPLSSFKTQVELEWYTRPPDN